MAHWAGATNSPTALQKKTAIGRDAELQERQLKLERVRRMMEEQKLDALILTRRDNFAWLTAGGDNHCASNTEFGVACILVTEDRQYVVTSNIEAQRMRDEELTQGNETLVPDFEVVAYPWYQGPGDALRGFLDNRAVGADSHFPGARLVGSHVAALRYPFTPWEVERYRPLGRAVASTVERVCLSLAPGLTELAIAGMAGSALMSEGIAPTVVLVGTDERILRYRHPIPTGRPLDKHCMIVVCAQKGGLTVALTRTVHFGSLPEELRDRHWAAVKVDARLICSSRAGMRFSDVFMEGMRAYEELGYPGEWRNHHQGGPIGYQDREFLATPETKSAMLAGQAVAWNPSVPGAKSEDTILVSEQGPEVVTMGDVGWPMIEVDVHGRDVSRPGILGL